MSGRVATSPGLVLLARKSASASANISFTSGITSRFRHYVITWTDVLMATAGASLRGLVSEDAGSSWKSGAADYLWAGWYVGTASSLVKYANAGAAFLPVGCEFAMAAGQGGSGAVELHHPSGTAAEKLVRLTGRLKNGSELVEFGFAGNYAGSVNAINGFRFVGSAGNITRGEFLLYGVRR